MRSPARLSNSGIRSEGFGCYFRQSYLGSLGWIWYKIYFALMVVLTFVLTRFSMLNILGYEFAAVITLFTANFTAVLVIRELYRLRPGIQQRSPVSSGPEPRLFLWGVTTGVLAAMGWILLIILIEIVAIDLLSASIRNCDPLTGLGFYIAVPVVSSFFTVWLATLCSTSTGSRKAAGFLYFTILLIFFLRLAYILAYGHSVGPKDPIIGILNLPVYNREANLDSGFLFSRLFVLVSALLIASLAVLSAGDKYRKYSLKHIWRNLRRTDTFFPTIQDTWLFGALFILGIIFQGPLGINITRNYLETVLDGKVDSGHFIIHYPTGGEVEEDIERIAEDIEYYYWSIVQDIGTAPEDMLRAYIYPDRRMKTILTGAGSSLFAKPWTGEIHVEYSKNRIRALKHELVHVVTAPIGVPLFGSSMLGAYGEGIAEGIQYDTGNDLTYHQWTATLREADDPYRDGPFFDRGTDPILLLTRNFRPGGFYVGRIGMNYYLSASHTRWFLDTYGPEAYAQAYIHDDTEAAIGLSQTDEANAWMEYIDHVPLRGEEIAYAKLAFSPPRFVSQVCAHELAEHEGLAEEYIRRMQWGLALNEYNVLLDYSHENPMYGYQRIKMAFYDEDFDLALELIRQMRQWETIDESWMTYLLLLEGDIHARSGSIALAEEAYNEAFDSALTPSFRENVLIRLEMLNSPALEEFQDAMREPQEARWRLERAAKIDETWLPLYLLGVNLANDRMYEEASIALQQCLDLEPPFDFIKRAAYFNLGVCEYRLDDLSLARQYFRDSGLYAADIFIEEHPGYDMVIPLSRLDSWSVSITDWLNRCDWRETWDGIVIDAASE